MSSSGEQETEKSLWEISLRVILISLFVALLYPLFEVLTGQFQTLIEEWERYLWSGSLVFLACVGFMVIVIGWDQRFRSLPPEKKPEVETFFKKRPPDVPITREEVYLEIREILKRYIADVELTPDTALFHDLELCGDDVDYFFHDVSSKFDLWEPLFDSQEFFPSEEDVTWSWRIKKEKFGIMTVGDLSDMIFQALREKYKDSERSFEMEN